jgi:hypothetical protein
MKNLRGFVVPVAITVLVGLGVSGCGDSSSTAAPEAGAATTAPADPKAALAASTKELAGGNYAFKATSPDADAEGVVHIPSKSGSIKLEGKTEGFAIHMDLLLVDADRWVRMSTPQGKSILDEKADPDTWFHVDASKLSKDADFGVDVSQPDMLYVGTIVTAATTVQGDAHTITGTIDGTKITSEDAFLDSQTIKDVGAAASALPFTATLDDQGRLTKLVIDVPKAGDTAAGKWTVELSGYGEQKALTKPSGTVKEMDSAQLELFG